VLMALVSALLVVQLRQGRIDELPLP